ncbi:MAG: hypothetical protein ABFE02_16010 [Sulfuricella sp.]
MGKDEETPDLSFPVNNPLHCETLPVTDKQAALGPLAKRVAMSIPELESMLGNLIICGYLSAPI